MDSSKKPAKAGRRDFLKLAGAGAVGAAAAAVSSTESAEAAVKDETSSGYRETDHVRQVYASQRF